MSNLREAAKHALEALENCSSKYGHRCNRCDSEVDEGGKIADALRAALAQEQNDTKDEVVRFLLGEAPLDGVWFGDKHPARAGMYWWRSLLSAALIRSGK